MHRADNDKLLVTDVLAGRVSRRALLKRASLLGLSAPVIASLLASCDDGDEIPDEEPELAATPETADVEEPVGEQRDAPDDESEDEPIDVVEESGPVDDAEQESQSSRDDSDSKHLRLLWWQAVDTLNPHLAQGTKDFDAASVVYEALAYVDTDGQLIPRLATEIPSLENGSVDPEGMWVEWTLRENVFWQDDEQFTAEDVRFTWEFVTDESTPATTFATYEGIDDVEIVDEFAVRVHFRDPTPGWFVPFTGVNGLIIPEHLFREYQGSTAPNAPYNMQPVGTGPFRVADFRPGTSVQFERHAYYWERDKPYFDRIDLIVQPDVTENARAVLVTGDADWASNIQVEADVLNALATEGVEGSIHTYPDVSTERLMINFADPWTEVDGARSEPINPHPFLTEPLIRHAIRLSIERNVIADDLYGPAGMAASNNLNQPEWAVNQDLSWSFDLDQAAALLDEAGAIDSDADGVREYNDTRLYLLFQTTVNPIRQITQEIVKEALDSIGFDVELKAVDSTVFFSGDPENSETFGHFYADLQMYTNGPTTPYPVDWAHRFASWEIAERINDWTGANSSRYANEVMDSIILAMATAMEPEEQASLFQEMNQISVEDGVEIPIVYRAGVVAVANSLAGYEPGPWVSELWNIGDWYRQE